MDCIIDQDRGHGSSKQRRMLAQQQALQQTDLLGMLWQRHSSSIGQLLEGQDTCQPPAPAAPCPEHLAEP